MKFYALPKTDGGVAIMQCRVDPAVELNRWPEHQRAIVTGEIIEIDPATIPKDRAHRDAWKVAGGKIEIDPVKKSEIESRPKPLSLEQRIAALEAKDNARIRP